MNPTRKYELNEAFFSSVTGEAQAYWLGFLMADGCVFERRGRPSGVQVKLAVADRGHLDALRLSVGSTAPARVVDNNGHPAVFWRANSVQMAQDLINLGCTVRKTDGHVMPKLPAELMSHFFRGYFDGDGSISCHAKGSDWTWQVVGVPGFVVALQEWLVKQAGVPRSGVYGYRTTSKVVALRYRGGKQAQRILDRLYAGATIALPRKHRIYHQLVNRVDGRKTLG